MRLKTYAETCLSREELHIFSDIERTMKFFPEDDDYGIDHRGRPVVLSCHIVAFAVAEIFGGVVNVAHGHYHPFFEHSWLTTKQGNVIDVYPVGTLGGPVLVDSIVARALYKPLSIDAHSVFQMPWFCKSVEKIAASFLEGIEREPMHTLKGSLI